MVFVVCIYIYTLIWISMRVQQQLWHIPPSYNLGYSYIGVYSFLFPPKNCCPFEQQIYTVYIADKHTHTHSHTVCTHYVICIKYCWISFTGLHISINYTTSAKGVSGKKHNSAANNKLLIRWPYAVCWLQSKVYFSTMPFLLMALVRECFSGARGVGATWSLRVL